MVYLDVVMLLNFLVDWLLLLAVNRLSGFPLKPGRTAIAAALGGVYAGACLLPGLAFLGNTLWRLVSLLLMGSIAFGVSVSALRRSILFVLLCMALGGVALGLGSGSFWALAGSAAVLLGMCLLGFRNAPGSVQYVDVELQYLGWKEKLTALKDTGNTLCDPVTGRGVLVVSGKVAQRLLGLTCAQLSSPVETVASGCIPGLRLVPYRSVGAAGGMLVALRMENVRIGGKKSSVLVAFAPEGLDGENTFQALIGGAV